MNQHYGMRRSVLIEKLGEELVTGQLVIATPVRIASGEYVCKWKLLPYFQEQSMYGIDALSALCITLAFIRTVIKGERDKGVHIYFLRRGDCCGIPRLLTLSRR